MTGEVVVLDATNNNTVIKRNALATGANAIAFSPDGRYAYATDLGSKVHVFDTTTNTEVATIATPKAPQYIMTSADGTAAYVLGLDLTNYGQPATIYKITGSTANQKPEFDITKGATDPDTGAVTYTLDGTDDDNDDVTYSATSLTGTIVENGDGTFTYTQADPNDTITFYANDGHGGISVKTVTIAPNNNPTLEDEEQSTNTGYGSRQWQCHSSRSRR